MPRWLSGAETKGGSWIILLQLRSGKAGANYCFAHQIFLKPCNLLPPRCVCLLARCLSTPAEKTRYEKTPTLFADCVAGTLTNHRTCRPRTTPARKGQDPIHRFSQSHPRHHQNRIQRFARWRGYIDAARCDWSRSRTPGKPHPSRKSCMGIRSHRPYTRFVFHSIGACRRSRQQTSSAQISALFTQPTQPYPTSHFFGSGFFYVLFSQQTALVPGFRRTFEYPIKPGFAT